MTISTWQNHFWDINLCFPPYFPFIPVQSRCILSRPFEMSCLRMLCRRNYGECQKTLKTWGLWRSDAMCLGRRKRRALGSKVRERKTFSKLRKETEVEGFRIVRSILLEQLPWWGGDSHTAEVLRLNGSEEMGMNCMWIVFIKAGFEVKERQWVVSSRKGSLETHLSLEFLMTKSECVYR